MKKYLVYLFLYSVGGFLLERVINLFFYQEYVDNSVMYGPYQPLYGVGIVLAIIVYDLYLKKMPKPIIRYALLLVVAILTTAFSEFFHGEGYLYFTGDTLWNYGEFFPCSYPFVCVYPTTLFGFFSAVAIIYVHPYIENYEKAIPTYVKISLLSIFFIDYIVTIFTKII